MINSHVGVMLNFQGLLLFMCCIILTQTDEASLGAGAAVGFADWK